MCFGQSNSVAATIAATIANPMGSRTGAAANDLGGTTPLSAVDGADDDGQADDPVDAVMGGDIGEVDPYAGDIEDDDPEVLPPGFEVMHIRREVIERVREEGQDPRVVRITVHPVFRNKRRTAVKRLRPESITFARLKASLATGTYDLMAYNDAGTFMGCKRLRIDDAGDFDELDELDELDGGRRGRRGRGASSLGDRLVYELAMKGLRGSEAAGRGSEMGEAIGSMAKMMTLNMQAQAMEATARMKQLELEHKVSRSDSNSQLSTLKTILEVIDKRTPKRSGAGGAKVEDFVGMLQMGMHFQKMMQDGKTDVSDSEEMRKWVLPIVDSVGPQLIGLAAMFLPTDKAQILTELLEQHMKTQEARANAAGDEKDTYDTTAEEVKK